MARHHLRFKSIKSEVVRAAEVLFEARPHTASPEDRDQAVRAFLVAASDAYGVSVPELRYGGRRLSYGVGESDALGDDSIAACIVLRRFSVLNLFRGLRLHLVATGVVNPHGSRDDLGWACSLYYLVRPVQFRKIARAGRVPEVYPVDTYSTVTWQRMVSVGVVNEWNRLLVPAFDPRDLDAIEQGDLDPFGGNDQQSDDDEYAPSTNNGERTCPECGGEGYFEPNDDLSDPEECDVCNGDGTTPAAPTARVIDPEETETTLLPDPQLEALLAEEAALEDGLDGLGIVKLRRLGSGQGIEGMWDLSVPDLRAALRAKGIRVPQS